MRGRIMAVLKKGETVIALEEQPFGLRDLWFRVRLDGGRDGWMEHR